MESRFETSFVPKKSATPRVAGPKLSRPRRSVFGIVPSVASALFVIALIASVGLFLYKELLARNINSLSEDLAAARASFEPQVIEQLRRIDARIKVAKGLLDQHMAPSPLFAVLESETLRNVAFSSFSYAADTSKTATLAMQGEALGFSTIALQADLFSKHPSIHNPEFSAFNQRDNGRVGFQFMADIDPRLVLFSPSTGAVEETVSGVNANDSEQPEETDENVLPPDVPDIGIPTLGE